MQCSFCVIAQLFVFRLLSAAERGVPNVSQVCLILSYTFLNSSSTLVQFTYSINFSTSLACRASDAALAETNKFINKCSAKTNLKFLMTGNKPLDYTSPWASKKLRMAGEHLWTILRFTHLADHLVALHCRPSSRPRSPVVVSYNRNNGNAEGADDGGAKGPK